MTDSYTPPFDPPPDVDVTRPSAARIYDYYLGGGHHWAIDRDFGERAVRKFPLIMPLARANRRWLLRVVRAALDAGITQFLDLGSGLPTTGSVHETVRYQGVDGRVVYVDNEPVATAHARLTLDHDGSTAWCGVVQADLRSPESVWSDPETKRLLDLTQPICVVFAAVLHFVGAGIPEILARYRRELVPGSWVAISHVANDEAPPDGAAQMEDLRASYDDTQNPAYLRNRAEITSWFDGLSLVEPGVVHLPDWHSDYDSPAAIDEPTELLLRRVRPYFWCGVGAVPQEPAS